MFSEANAGSFGSEGLLGGLVSVAPDKVLKEQLRVSEVGAVVLEGLTMAAHESLLEIGSPPDPALHLLASQQVLALSDELIGAELNILVEKVATKNLLAILVVDEVAHDEEGAKSGLGHEGHVLVVEHDIVVVEEQEGGEACKEHVLLVVGVLNVQIGHIIIPLRVVGVQEHSVEGELWSNTLGNIKKIKHLLNGLVALLAHTSAQIGVLGEQNETYLWTGRLPLSTPRSATVVKYLSILVNKLIINKVNVDSGVLGFWGFGVLGSNHVVEQLSFSMLP